MLIAPARITAMAPKRGSSIERTNEREDFMRKLEEYHQQRGYVHIPSSHQHHGVH